MNPAWGFPRSGLCRRGTAGQEQCELALEQMKMRAKIKGSQVHCQLLKPEGQRIALCTEQKALSPALSRALDVLQPGLSRDRNSTPSICPFSQIPHPCFFHHFPGLCHHLPCRLLPLLGFSSPLQEMPGLHGRRDSCAGPGLGKASPNPLIINLK